MKAEAIDAMVHRNMLWCSARVDESHPYYTGYLEFTPLSWTLELVSGSKRNPFPYVLRCKFRAGARVRVHPLLPTGEHRTWCSECGEMVECPHVLKVFSLYPEWSDRSTLTKWREYADTRDAR